MKILRILIFQVLFLLLFQITLSGVSFKEGANLVSKGIDFFSKGFYEQSLLNFRRIIGDPNFRSHHGDAHFWTAKCLMVLGRYEDASKSLEYYLSKYKNHLYYSEGLYQKGRLLFLQNEYENSIQILEDFIDKFPTSDFISNAYFWIGESLFSLGKLDNAFDIFKYVVQNYPNSYKFESAKYRISIIQFKRRENELLKLLKWSHMEARRMHEEYKRRENIYEQALSSSQKKLSEAGTFKVVDEYTEADIEKLTDMIAAKNEEIKKYKKEIVNLNNKIAIMEGKPPNLSEERVSVSEDTITQIEDNRELGKKREMIDLKEAALGLKENLLNLLEQVEGEK